ncbi:MAG: GNAT family N-acetyltransferase [Dermatophilaceae bacterium]
MTATSLRLLDPVADLDLVHRWVTEPRAVYWGMTDKSREEVGDIYRWLQDQDHLAAYLISLEDVPVGIVQTYDPLVDEIGDHYDRRPGDLGMHLFLADSPARAGHTAAMLRFVIEWLAARPDTRRLVAEPDAANQPSIARFASLGFRPGPLVRLPHKVAQFLFLDVRPAA